MLRSGAFSHDQAGVPAHGERRHLGADAWFLPGHGPARAHQVPAVAHSGIHAEAHAAARTAHRADRDQRAFGFGIHQCIGRPLARIELRVALTELARRFPDLALAAPADQLIMRSHSIAFGPEHLPVTW